MAADSSAGAGETLRLACASRLGVGTIWFGRQWPPGNPGYGQPTAAEIAAFLDASFSALVDSNTDKPDAASPRVPHVSSATGAGRGLLHVDTATAYGGSETALAAYFTAKPERREQVLLATKWGGSYEREVEGNEPAYRLTAAQLRLDATRSIALLGPLDVLYAHMPSSVPEAEILACLRDPLVAAELQHLRHTGQVRFVGVSISNLGVLRTALQAGLLDTLDAVQFPARLWRDDPALWTELCRRLPHTAFVANSPVRGATAASAAARLAAAARSALGHPHAFLLTGTRHHLHETVAIWREAEAKIAAEATAAAAATS